MIELTALATRLDALIKSYPDGVPVEELSIEVRRVQELAHMMEVGLVGEA